MSELLEKIAVFERLAEQLEEKLADPEIASSPKAYATFAKELSDLRPLAGAGTRYRSVLTEITDAQGMLADSDPGAEYEETLDKGRAIFEALQP